MKTLLNKKKSKRVMAVLMAVLLAIGIMPMDWTLTKPKAAESKVYTFESSALQAATAGSFTDGQEVKAGTDDYFTLYMSAKTKIDSSSKTWDDGYASEQRLNLGGKADLTVPKNVISFKTEGAASIKVWWVEGGDDNRQVAIYKADGTEAAKTSETLAKNAVAISTLEVSEGGTYYLGGDINNNYFFKIEVTEAAAAAEPVINEYLFESSALQAAAAGSFTDGQEVKAGTKDFFTLYMSAKTKIDSSSKTWDDGYASGQRLNLGGKADLTVPKNVISFTTEGTASVKVWWVEGGDDNRQVAIYKADGTEAAKTSETLAKNAVAISTLTLSEPGTYYMGGDINNNYFFKVQVTDTVGGGSTETERKAWSDVASPVLGTPTLKNESTITIPYEMVIGKDGADSVLITVKDSAGNELTTLKSLVEGASGSKEFTPENSGDYTFSIKAVREGEEDKVGADVTFTGFALPLTKSSIGTIYSEGNGSVALEWSEVKEAESYAVEYSADGTTWASKEAGSALNTVVTGLTVGREYTFRVVAKRGNDSSISDTATCSVTEKSQQKWSFSAFGQGVSSDTKNSGYEGSANDGKVTVWGLNGKGKIVPASTDGLSFYYTAVPSNKNFTLSATVTVDQWTLSNGQEGFGLMAADRVGKNGDSSVFWNNSYMASVTKVEYYTNPDGTVALDTIKQGSSAAPDGSLKVTMKLGIGAQEKVGVTKDNLAKLEANDTATVNNEFSSKMTTLEYSGVTGNVVGNATAAVSGTVENPLTTFKMSIQKNNTGYFVSYTNEAGEVVTQKYYDTKALEKLDEENVYVGFFASRNAKITVTDINLTTVSPEDDDAKEEQPVTTVAPSYKIPSASVANSENYKLSYVANADGHVVIKAADGTVIAEQDVVAGQKYVYDTKLALGENEFTVTMTPVQGYKPSEFEVLESYEPVTFSYKVTYNKFDGDVIYVGPDATSSGKGTKENPIDIYSAVKFASAGQTIVILSGTYNLESTVTVQPGIDGTADKPIILMADPDGDSRPVFDFGRNCEGMVFGGDYWYVQGFDVTNSANGKDGVRLGGSHCTMDNLRTYHNGNTGLQISRFATTDTREEWPSYNLILNCTSFGNADEGYEDADGFAAKLTIGDGNVFDGCIAYNNADDGWDLFAKVESGAIGSVTIQNCVAYANGYLEDGTNAGNGNGFKMGGSSITGYHKLINSIAFDNKAKGIDSNSCPDIQVTNCTSYNNGGSNVALYTNDAANTDFMATGVISYRTQFTDVAENFKLKGTQDKSKVYQSTNYFWNCTEQGTNNSNGTVTNDWFVSVDTKMDYTAHVYSSAPVTRNSDNTINMNGLLVLSDVAKAIVGDKSGAVVGGTPTPVIAVTGTVTSGLLYHKSSTGVNTFDGRNVMAYILLLLAAAACIFATSKKRKNA